MIEISHKQARYLIREVQDRRLPEEQWAALQAHLERCPECRSYQRRITGLERELRRLLRQRWSTVSAPAADFTGQVLAQRARIREVHYARLGALFFIAVVALLWWGQVASPAPEPAPAAPQPTRTPTPVLQFRGLVLFESNHTGAAGNSDVFLLNSTGSSTPELSNLTNNPAQDSDPAWSPDGEWIAFLSDRSGKRELYVISVAGTRLTQLTADPDIDWEGPLSWFWDGQWIALAGRRLSQDGDRWGYLVPLSGKPPISLPGTRNMAGNMLFSPTQPLLATPGQIFNLNTGWSFDGWYGLATEGSSAVPGLKAGPEAAFDWAVSGSSLAYLAARQFDPPDSKVMRQIRLSPVIALDNRGFLEDNRSEIVDQASVNSKASFRSLSFMPDGPYLVTLQDKYSAGCWTIHMVNAFHYQLLAPTDLEGLCVDGSLESASWSSAGPPYLSRWLAVTGRQANPVTRKPTGPPGIYVIRNAPQASALEPVPEVERLLELPAGLVTVPRTVPRVRPTGGASLNIQPVAAQQGETASVHALPPQAVTDGMLLAGRDVKRPWNSSIVRLNSVGKEIVLVPEGADSDCPTRSPDGQKIAYRSRAPGKASGIFVMDADGSRPKLVAAEEGRGAAGWNPAYDCPVWSPDGHSLAAVRYEGSVTRLAVMDAENGVQAIFPIESPSKLARPLWSPNGKGIYLAETSARISSAYLVFASWSTLTGPTTVRVLSGWDDIQAMTFSPDGTQIALIAVQNPTVTQAARANLFIIDLQVHGGGLRAALPDYDPRAVTQPGRMVWLPDGHILFAQPSGPLAVNKASFVTFDPHDGAFETLAASADALIDWAYRDGWLVYSSESGLWAHHVSHYETDGIYPLPVRLSSQVITSLELK